MEDDVDDTTGRLGKERLAMSVYQWEDPCY